MLQRPSDVPPTRYARSGGVDIAYQVLGEGPIDLVFSGGWVTHLEYGWQQPRVADVYRRLARFSRLIVFDKRGTGLSERFAVDRPPTLEERMDDVRAVMDAVGSEQAALLGTSEGGPMCMLFAATYPDRTRALILFSTFARRIVGPDYPIGPTAEEWDAYIASLEPGWGGPVGLDLVAPTAVGDPAVEEWWATYLRLGATPRVATEILRLNAAIDVRPILPTIRVPTLVLHRRDDQVFPLEFGRYTAEHIPGARLVELPGVDHQFWAGDTGALVDEVEEFLTGARRTPPSDRILTTLLFTDIVGSTDRLAELGDVAWRALLDSHDRAVRTVLERYGGIEVATTGDGFLARFDGPGRAVQAALAICRAVDQLGLRVRVGVHTGEVELVGEDVRGIAVHLAARVMALAGAGEVVVTRTVRDLVAGSGIAFEDRGAHQLKGVPGEWEVALAVPDSG